MGPSLSGRPLNVLVVEDNRDSAEALCVLLSLWGHHPHAALDAASAWDLALAHRPDVILLDLGLPGVDGWQLARRFRAEPALGSPLIIAVTGYGQQTDREKSAAAGIHLHLIKPVEPDVLKRVLDTRQQSQGPPP